MNHVHTPVAIAVVGLGNVLQQDDGIGVHAVNRLRERDRLPAVVRILDGGTLGLSLLPYVDDATHVLMVDAVRMGRPPGTIVRLDGVAFSMERLPSLSVHEAGVIDLIGALNFARTDAPTITVFGVEPQVIDWGTEMTPPVAAQLDTLVHLVEMQVDAWMDEALH
jgi:hydrogenase maturation protease